MSDGVGFACMLMSQLKCVRTRPSLAGGCECYRRLTSRGHRDTQGQARAAVCHKSSQSCIQQLIAYFFI